MNRRQVLGGLLGGAAALGVGAGGTAYANGCFRPRSLAGASATNPILVPLTPQFINTYLVMGDRPIVVDTGNVGNAGLMLERLKELGIAPRDVALILLTHGHFDHFGSAKALQEATGAPIAIHEADAEAVSTGISRKVNPVSEIGFWGHLIQWQVATFPPGQLERVQPKVLLRGDETLEDYGLNARIVHTPGHTPGSVTLTYNSQAIVGDLFSADMLFTDQPDNPYFAEDLEQNRQSIRRLLESDLGSFQVGHGLAVNATSVRRRFAAAS